MPFLALINLYITCCTCTLFLKKHDCLCFKTQYKHRCSYVCAHTRTVNLKINKVNIDVSLSIGSFLLLMNTLLCYKYFRCAPLTMFNFFSWPGHILNYQKMSGSWNKYGNGIASKSCLFYRRYPSLRIATALHVQFLSISMALFTLTQDVRVELKW